MGIGSPHKVYLGSVKNETDYNKIANSCIIQAKPLNMGGEAIPNNTKIIIIINIIHTFLL